MNGKRKREREREQWRRMKESELRKNPALTLAQLTGEGDLQLQ
jgi:hypothetical protein